MIDHKQRDLYIDTFLEGASIAPVEMQRRALVGMVYDLRAKVKSHEVIMADMDDIARDNGWTVKCRSCGEVYSPDIELSEFSHEGNYCGKSEHCCP